MISDASTDKYCFVEHYNIDDYSKGADAFKMAYIHMSSNPYDYELICFQRWFCIRDFVKTQKIENFLCMDSDVLLYCNIDEVMQQYISYNFTTCNKQGLAALYSIYLLYLIFVNMMSMYTEDILLNKMKIYVSEIIDNKQLGGVCDSCILSGFRIIQNAM